MAYELWLMLLMLERPGGGLEALFSRRPDYGGEMARSGWPWAEDAPAREEAEVTHSLRYPLLTCQPPLASPLVTPKACSCFLDVCGDAPQPLRPWHPTNNCLCLAQLPPQMRNHDKPIPASGCPHSPCSALLQWSFVGL